IVTINLVIIFNKKEKSKKAAFFFAISSFPCTVFLAIMLGSQEVGHWFHWLVNMILLIVVGFNTVCALAPLYFKEEKVSKEFMGVAQGFAAAYFIYILVLWALPKLIY
ncbi:MAG: hypothetical protein RI945_401, partial [Candidatus Parcubacteria bacterium]